MNARTGEQFGVQLVEPNVMPEFPGRPETLKLTEVVEEISEEGSVNVAAVEIVPD